MTDERTVPSAHMKTSGFQTCFPKDSYGLSPRVKTTLDKAPNIMTPKNIARG